MAKWKRRESRPAGKPLRDMTEPELSRAMNRVARLVEAALPEGTVFALLAFDNPDAAQYCSNGRRGDVIAALRECAARIEARDTVERTPFGEGG